MPQRLEQERHVLGESQFEKDQRKISTEFLKRYRRGKISIKEDPEDHMCVYFAAFDPQAGEIFIGHHKKSGLWLFNGGHIDSKECAYIARDREMVEEWGFIAKTEGDGSPSLQTITKINNPEISCKTHYDHWYFVPVNKKDFSPREELLSEEFHTMGWKTIPEALEIVTDPNTLLAIEQIQRRLINT